ncbi:MAG: uroporphyrinogen-III C-methyltransferase [Arenicellales bacterium]
MSTDNKNNAGQPVTAESNADKAVKPAVTTNKSAQKKRPQKKRPQKKRAQSKVASMAVPKSPQKTQQKANASKPAVQTAGSPVIADAQPAALPMPNEEKRSTGRGIAWLALLCSLGALAAGGYAAYQTTLSQKITHNQTSGFDDRLKLMVSDQQSLKSNVDGISNQAKTLGTSVETKFKGVDETLAKVDKSIVSLQASANASIADVKADLGESVARWKLEEVQSLLGRVNQLYEFTGDKARTLKGLDLVKASLASVSNPAIAPVVSALAQDTLRIKAAKSVDVQGLNNQLSSIAPLVSNLALISEPKKPDAKVDAKAEKEGSKPQDEGLFAMGKTLLGDLGSMVKHTKLDAPLKPSLDDSAKFILFESLRLKLQAASTALLSRDNTNFQAQISSARVALKANFDAKQDNAQTIAKALESLAAQDVSLAVEGASNTLAALNRVMNAGQ